MFDNSQHTISPVKRTLYILLAIIAIIVGLTVNKYLVKDKLSGAEIDEMGGIVFEASRSIKVEGLLDFKGEVFDKSRLKNKWSLIYFGYTFCPDICPTSLSKINHVINYINSQDNNLAAKAQYIMVTVDPRRDTAEKLAAYLPYFNEQFIGVTGDEKKLYELALQMNVPYIPVVDPTDEFYLVDHGSNLAIVDPKGNYCGIIRPPFTAENVYKLLKYLDDICK